ncbi:MAG: ABC transporter permease [Blastocatellia bacterium]
MTTPSRCRSCPQLIWRLVTECVQRFFRTAAFDQGRRQRVYGSEFAGNDSGLRTRGHLDHSGGRFFTKEENERREPVCVVGASVAENFFPFTSPLDRTIEIGGTDFRIVGVLEKREQLFAAATGRTIKTT